MAVNTYEYLMRCTSAEVSIPLYFSRPSFSAVLSNTYLSAEGISWSEILPIFLWESVRSITLPKTPRITLILGNSLLQFLFCFQL